MIQHAAGRVPVQGDVVTRQRILQPERPAHRDERVEHPTPATTSTATSQLRGRNIGHGRAFLRGNKTSQEMEGMHGVYSKLTYWPSTSEPSSSSG